MDSIKVSKVEHVSCSKSGVTLPGTIHVTAHHLIFQYDDGKEDELWVPYPLISLVTRQPQTLQGQSPLMLHTRTFETFSFSFTRETDASDVFDSVKELTVATSVYQLYAFFYTPNPPYPVTDGWSLYSPREEFGRMGIGSRTKAWRFTDINKDYSFCPTYPSRLVVPTKISDTTLQYAAKYRSKCRIPVLSYLHWANYGSITRSSQPMVGLTQNRSIQDEKLIEAIFQSHHSPESRASSSPVYGATSTNLIIDARPTTNAVANTAKGAGTENMDHYREGKKAYLGIDHIHVMRESLGKVVEALREADSLLNSINIDLPDEVPGLATLDRQALRRSGWLRHISAILEGTVLITRNVHVNSSHVLIHCSDGWDRTSQLSAMAQLCLDPFYRTIRGFQILVEKDWLSYGHKFLDRCGHLSSEKFFLSPADTSSAGGSTDAAQAFLASVQNRFVSQQHVKETSPVFHQFLETVQQVQRQYPERFEFNQRYLKQLYYHLYSCQFGTFLFNSERERRVGDGGPPPCDRTVSVWDFFNSPSEMEQNLNPTYDPSLDDPTSRVAKADMGVLFPNPKDVRFWNELYGRTDEEMNGRIVIATQIPTPEIIVRAGGIENDPAIQRSGTLTPIPPSPTPLSPAPIRSASLLPLSPTPRSISPSLATSPRELSTSLPEVSKRPSAPREDNFEPFPSSSSTFSLRPTSPAAHTADSTSSLNRSRTSKPPDFFASSGVKSVWGKLSSNASAALSVVQEAYVGVAKDLRNTEPTDGELQHRKHLSAWGEDSLKPRPTRSTPGTPSVFVEQNPWITTRSRPITPIDSSDNPWRTLPIVEPLPGLSDAPASSSNLPADPTIAHPPHRSAYTPPEPSSSSLTPTAPSILSSDTDPLGVGLS